jgi:hypothetical protein
MVMIDLDIDALRLEQTTAINLLVFWSKSCVESRVRV